MSKHTEGNWRIVDVLGCVTVFAGNPERVIVRYDSPSQEEIANARLIASAPKTMENAATLRAALLLACERIADGPQEYHEANTPEGWVDVYMEEAAKV